MMMPLSATSAASAYRMNHLPFPHYFFDDVTAVPKDPYESMKTLIEFYGFNFDTFKQFMIQNIAIMSGSAVLRVLLNNRVNYTPGDLDIWMKLENSNSNNNYFIKYILTQGYTIDMSSMFPFSLSNKSILDDEDEDDDEDDDDDEFGASGHAYRSSMILRVLTFLKGDKKIQFVFTRIHGFHFVKRQFDISVTASYWYPLDTNKSDVHITPHDNGHLYRLEFYICNHFVKYMKLLDTDKRKRKLMERIRKYEERGFKLVEDPLECLDSFDPRIDVAFLKGEAHEMISSENVAVSTWLRDYKNIIVYLTKDSIQAVNRHELYEYIMKNKKTYWGHEMSTRTAKYLLYADYSIYVLGKIHPSVSRYSLECYTILRSIYKSQLFEIDYAKKERMDNMRLYQRQEKADKHRQALKERMERIANGKATHEDRMYRYYSDDDDLSDGDDDGHADSDNEEFIPVVHTITASIGAEGY
jgi:hypothetical protein